MSAPIRKTDPTPASPESAFADAMRAADLHDAVAALARLGCKPTKSGDGYVAFCPIHEADGHGHKPSLNLKAGDTQAVVVNCHAGCDGREILKALDITPAPRHNGKRRIVATYSYRDLDGREAFQKIRYEPKDFRQRWPDGQGGWLWKRPGNAPYFLYRLPELKAAIAEGRTVFICEGEKDADRLASLGLMATSNVEGASKPEQRPKWKAEYTEQLTGAARAILLPHNDEQGRAHMRHVAAQLAGKVGEVRWLELAGLPDKGDVSDWLNAGHTVDELERLANEAQEPPPLEAQEPPPIGSDGGKLPPLIFEHKGEIRLTSQQKAAGILAKTQEFEQIRYHAIHNDFYHYDKAVGIFERKPALLSESAVYRAIRKYSDDFPFSAAYVSGVTKCLTWETATDFEPLKNHIGFKNGVLRLSDKKLFPHDPSFGLTFVLPYDWLPDAPEPTAVIEWLLDAVSGHPDRVQVLRAVINACITGRADLQRFIELIGPGGSGKGTFIRLVTALVGFLAVHSTDLKSLEGNRFESAKIFGKKVVVITDAERWHGDVSMLKAITGQDRIRFEEKHKQAGESFEFAGMVIIAGNQHTESTDYSSGIQRRRVTIPFEHVVPAHQRRDLDAEFEPLLPDVAAWALAMPRDDVTSFLRNTDNAARSLYAAKLDALAATNTVAAWLLDNVVFDESAKTKVGAKKKVTRHGMSESRVEYEHADEWLYPNFAAWCEGNGKNPVAHNVFSRAAIEIATTTLGRGFVRKAVSGNGAHIEGLRLRRDEELVRSHEELVRNSLPNSEVYSIENYELSKNEELLDISTDFPCSQADNSAAIKSCEENQESFKESLGVPHVHNFQSVSPHKFLTSSSQSSSQVRNSPPPGPDIPPDIASAPPAETASAAATCTDERPDMPSAPPPAPVDAWPTHAAPPICRPADYRPYRLLTRCDKPSPIYGPDGGDPVGCSHCGARWATEEVGP